MKHEDVPIYQTEQSDEDHCNLATILQNKKQVNSVNLYPLPEVALVCLKFILSFIKFCSLVTELWLICGF